MKYGQVGKGVLWKGNDGNWYVKAQGINGVKNVGKNSPISGVNGTPGYEKATLALTKNPGNPQPKSTADTTGGGGTATKQDPNTDPAHIAALRAQIVAAKAAFDQIFARVSNQINAAAADKKKQTMANYDTQQTGLDKNYSTTAQGIDNTIGSRGAFNSSYRASQQGTAKDAYDTATKQLQQGESSDLATIGQTADTQRAQMSAGRPNYNQNDYGTVSDLLSVKNAVDTALGNLKVSAAGVNTQGGFIKSLNSITPSVQDSGSAQLKSQLDKLAGTNAPDEAKVAIAQHAIKTAGADPAWMNYFQQQLDNTGSTPATNPNPSTTAAAAM